MWILASSGECSLSFRCRCTAPVGMALGYYVEVLTALHNTHYAAQLVCPWDEPGFVCECHVWRKFSWVSLTIRLHKGSQWCSICHSGSPLLVPGLLFCVSLLISGRQSQENHVLRDFFTCMHSSVNFVEQSFLSNFLPTTFFFFTWKQVNN